MEPFSFSRKHKHILNQISDQKVPVLIHENFSNPIPLARLPFYQIFEYPYIAIPYRYPNQRPHEYDGSKVLLDLEYKTSLPCVNELLAYFDPVETTDTFLFWKNNETVDRLNNP